MNLIFLYGNHSFARKKAKENAINTLYGEKKRDVTSFSVSVGTGRDNGILSKIRQKLAGQSLFARQEIVVVNLGGDRTNSAPAGEFIRPLLSRIPSNITLILDIAADLPRSSKLLKTVKKLGGDIQSFKLPSVKDRSSLFVEVNKFLAREKVNIDSYLVQKLINAGGGDWWYAFSALEQAVLLSHSCLETQNRILTETSLQELWDLQEEKSIFRLFDAIGRGEKAQAFNILYENSAGSGSRSGKEIETTLGLITLMARHISQIIAVKGGVSPGEAQKIWRIPTFAFSKLKHQASFFSLDFLKLAYEKLTELQEKAKSGLRSPLSLIDFFVFYMISHRHVIPITRP